MAEPERMTDLVAADQFAYPADSVLDEAKVVADRTADIRALDISPQSSSPVQEVKKWCILMPSISTFASLVGSFVWAAGAGHGESPLDDTGPGGYRRRILFQRGGRPHGCASISRWICSALLTRFFRARVQMAEHVRLFWLVLAPHVTQLLMAVRSCGSTGRNN
jgi:hypothetical protein